MVRENRIQATCPKFVFNPKVGQGMRRPMGWDMNVWWQVSHGDEITWSVSIFFQKMKNMYITCTNVRWNNWRCVPCKMDLSMKWSISTCQFVAALPTNISQQIPRNSPHRWWILSASIGSPVLIKVPWVDDFAGKNTGKWWWKAAKTPGFVRFLFGWNGTIALHEKLNICVCIYIYIRFKVERCFFFPISHVS